MKQIPYWQVPHCGRFWLFGQWWMKTGAIMRYYRLNDPSNPDSAAIGEPITATFATSILVGVVV